MFRHINYEARDVCTESSFCSNGGTSSLRQWKEELINGAIIHSYASCDTTRIKSARTFAVPLKVKNKRLAQGREKNERSKV